MLVAMNASEEHTMIENDEFAISFAEATKVTPRGGDIKPLEDDFYEAVVAAVVTRDMKPTDGGEKKRVIEVLWQIESNGAFHYLRSKSFTSLAANNEKSNFFLMLKGITKVHGPTDPAFGTKLESLGVLKEGYIRTKNLIGLASRVTVVQETNDKQKTYAKIQAYGPSKIAEPEVKADTISSAAMWGENVEYFTHPLITVRQAKEKAEETANTLPKVNNPFESDAF